MRQLSRELLQGALDLHTHGYPELGPDWGMAQDDVEMARYSRDAGMAGYVLKSHIWPTMDRVYHIRQQVPDFTVCSSIALNAVVGGISPATVEAAALQGAKVVWFPTWSAANDIERGGISRVITRALPGLKPHLARGIRILDAGGALDAAACDVLRVAKDANLVVSTGHLSPQEALALAGEAERIGFTRLVFGHPDSASVGATPDEMVEMARRGAYVEWTFIGMLPLSQRIRPEALAELVYRVGVDRSIVTTDTFGPWSLPEADLFALYLGILAEVGIAPAAIRAMAVETPKHLLAVPD